MVKVNDHDPIRRRTILKESSYMDLKEIAPGPNPPETVYAIVEIHQGGRNKYEYDSTLGIFRLDRVLYSSVQYPGDYGFIPGTLAEDGDPLDILVMTTEPAFTGCLLVTRPVGLLHMRDENRDDKKVLAVPVHDPRYNQIKGLEDVAPHFLPEVEHFFTVYKNLEGKAVEVLGWKARDAAEKAIMDAIQRRRQHMSTKFM
jgi:inorganic pyrophosphatase